MAAIRPALAAQVAADRRGDPSRVAHSLIGKDVNVLANAAKHSYGLEFPFCELKASGARRLQRFRRRASSALPVLQSVDEEVEPTG